MTAADVVGAAFGVVGTLLVGVSAWSFVVRSIRALFASAE